MDQRATHQATSCQGKNGYSATQATRTSSASRSPSRAPRCSHCAAAKNGKRYPETARWIYRCTLCHGFHLTSKPPASLGKNNGKRKGV